MRAKLIARRVSFSTLERLAVQAQLNRNGLVVGMLMKGEQGDIDAVFEVVRKLHTGGNEGKWYCLLDVLKEVCDVMNKKGN